MLGDDSNKIKIKEVKLVKMYCFISKFHFSNLFSLILSSFENRFRKNLLSKNPNLRNLDFYKLSLLLKKTKK